MKIYMIRHGQTDWNLAGKIQGKTDVPLNEEGRAQARFLAEAMKSRPAAKVFTSPLKRARETAQAVAEALEAPLLLVPEFEEVDFGLWEGLTWQQIGERYPKEYAGWRREPVEHPPVGGEGRESASLRAKRGLEILFEKSGGEDAALVAHGAILAYIRDALFENQEKPPEQIVKNASITTIEYDTAGKRAKILETNVTNHLND